MKLTIQNRDQDLQVVLEGQPCQVLFSEPTKERQVHRVLKTFVRHPVEGYRLPFQGLVVPEPKLPETKRPFKAIEGSIKPDFIGFAPDRVAIAELKVSFDESAVRQLVNQLTRLHTAMQPGPWRSEFETNVAKRIARTDLLFRPEKLREAAAGTLDLGAADAPLHGCLIVCDPVRPFKKPDQKPPSGLKNLLAWLQTDRNVPLWAFHRPSKRSLEEKAKTPVPKAAFDLLAASFLRAASSDLVAEIVCLWDAAALWSQAAENDTNRGWPRLDLQVEVDGLDVQLAVIPDGLVGVAVQWVDDAQVLRSATWTV
jgi:hypothetical protein